MKNGITCKTCGFQAHGNPCEHCDCDVDGKTGFSFTVGTEEDTDECFQCGSTDLDEEHNCLCCNGMGLEAFK